MRTTVKFAMVAGTALSLGGVALASDDASRAYAAEMLADANARTSQLAQPGSTFAPRVGGLIQFRYNWNNRDAGANAEDSTIGFQNARTVLTVTGNIANENWGYVVDGMFSDDSSQDGVGSGGSFTLRDAYGFYKIDNGWSISWGQAKAPVLREELVGDATQLAADRSTFNRAFTGGRTQGVIANYKGDSFRFWGAFTDGARSANADFNSAAEADYSLTGRLEYKWAGDWQQANDFTSFQNSQYFGMVGGAVHYQDGGDTGAGAGNTIDQSLLVATIDASAEGNGWNVFGAFAYTNLDPASGESFDDYGFLIQGGVFVAPQWELFGRFEYLIPDDNRGANIDDFLALTLGVNHYFVPESHAAKFTLDFQYIFNQTNNNSLIPTSTTGGVLGSTDDGEWNIRGQMQLVF